MNQYRITKYNPIFRNMYGHYTAREWTDFSDVGKEFNGVILTMDKYLYYENAYIKTAISMLKSCNINNLIIKNLEIYNNDNLFENQIFFLENIPNAIRNILRNNFWCKLETKEFFIHFGFDYYMYIGCTLEKEKVTQIANSNHLYCEEFLSPYCEKS